MKTKNFLTVWIIVFVLVACAPKAEVKPTEIATQAKVEFATLTFTPVPKTTLTRTPMATSTLYPLKGSCPLNLSQDDIYVFSQYSDDHLGMDIAAPQGTPHTSPGDCTVLYFFVQDDGGQGVQLRCANLPAVDRITLHHIDLSQNNYATLDYYGIPKNEVFNAGGKAEIGEYQPRANDLVPWGQDLHIYSGNTGKSGLPHTHISIWTLTDGNLDDRHDPLEYLECKE